MEDMRSEETGYSQWQGQRSPLPMPPRMPPSYDGAPSASSSSSSSLPFHGGAPYRNLYHPVDTGPPRDIPPLPSREQPATISGPALSTQPSYSSLKRSYQSLEGGGAYHENLSGPYDGGPQAEAPLNSKTTISPDHRLLSFARLPDRRTILDRHGRSRTVEISAQIHGMFFLSEMARNSSEGLVIQPELTCYRRNLFQISGSVTGPTGPLSVVGDRGEAIPVVSQELSVLAMESVDHHMIRLIVVPWKTPPANSPEMPPNHEQEPLPIPVFNPADGGQEMNSDMSVQSIAWRRLQFRVATANNGRRKELQQHFVLRLTLTATLATGAKVCIGECATAAIVVRGRSPRNFQARKEIPLGGSASASRAQALQVPPSDKGSPSSSISDTSRGLPLMGTELPKRPFQFDPSNFSPPVALRDSFGRWDTSQQPGQQHTMATAPTAPGNPPSHSNPHQFSHVIAPHTDNIPSTHTSPLMSSQFQQSATMIRPGYYNASSAATATLPHQYMDSNPRPTKSPRPELSPEMSGQAPSYPAFETRLGSPYQGTTTVAAGNPSGISSREYFATVPPSGPWTASSQSNAMYAGSITPAAQQYAFPSEAYGKDGTQQGQYSWSSE
ncbi:MAG: hypothetical protein M1818_000091 [Claussenomyces sp. TS43310]|nr:MAG: hypothetical protein M1818_000091 [Claussenomyces sp. TS43310]